MKFIWSRQIFKVFGKHTKEKPPLLIQRLVFPSPNLPFYGAIALGNMICQSLSNIVNFNPLLIFSSSHVKIRAFKSVQGKCVTCAILSNLRDQYIDNLRTQFISWLLSMHRSTYMGERMDYSLRYELSENFVIIVTSKFFVDVSKPKDTQNCFSPWLQTEWRKIIAFFHGRRILPRQ